MTPVPEPAGDIRAQLAAVMDPDHPKRAAFVVPPDAGQVPYVLNAYYETRPEGVLVTVDAGRADAFRDAPSETDAFDRVMAGILGYPEAKPAVIAACEGNPVSNARAVQARDAAGWVVTEAFASPAGLAATWDAIEAHVPPGGSMAVLMPAEAIARRVLLRRG